MVTLDPMVAATAEVDRVDAALRDLADREAALIVRRTELQARREVVRRDLGAAVVDGGDTPNGVATLRDLDIEAEGVAEGLQVLARRRVDLQRDHLLATTDIARVRAQAAVDEIDATLPGLWSAIEDAAERLRLILSALTHEVGDDIARRAWFEARDHAPDLDPWPAPRGLVPPGLTSNFIATVETAMQARRQREAERVEAAPNVPTRVLSRVRAALAGVAS
jgi:hypothetical protein